MARPVFLYDGENKMNGALGHLCAHIIGRPGPGEPPEDGVMDKMTLPSRQIIRNSCPGSEVEHATSRSRRLPSILNLYE